MKKLLLLLVILAFLVPVVQAQVGGESTDNGASRSGYFFGGGLGLYSYTTWWYWYNPGDPLGSREHYPIHVFSRQQFCGFFEKRSLFTHNKVHLDARAEIHFGFLGGTKEDWLPSGETISDGGSTYGAAVILKFAYPMEVSPTLPVEPYAGFGVQYTVLSSNGEGVGTEFADRAKYDYKSGWDESITAMPVVLGVEITFDKFVIIPEYRFSLFGGASTDWEPTGYAPEQNDSPSFHSFSISVGFKL